MSLCYYDINHYKKIFFSEISDGGEVKPKSQPPGYGTARHASESHYPMRQKYHWLYNEKLCLAWRDHSNRGHQIFKSITLAKYQYIFSRKMYYVA